MLNPGKSGSVIIWRLHRSLSSGFILAALAQADAL